jgi:hypothetical protein
MLTAIMRREQATNIAWPMSAAVPAVASSSKEAPQ